MMQSAILAAALCAVSSGARLPLLLNGIGETRSTVRVRIPPHDTLSTRHPPPFPQNSRIMYQTWRGSLFFDDVAAQLFGK